MRRLLMILPLVTGACATTGTPAPAPLAGAAPPLVASGLAGVLGQTADGLVARFGPAALDVREGPGRKLQFRGAICVMDAYLYPRDGREVVTYLDARQLNGGGIDRASCVAALGLPQPR